MLRHKIEIKGDKRREILLFKHCLGIIVVVRFLGGSFILQRVVESKSSVPHGDIQVVTTSRFPSRGCDAQEDLQCSLCTAVSSRGSVNMAVAFSNSSSRPWPSSSLSPNPPLLPRPVSVASLQLPGDHGLPSPTLINPATPGGGNLLPEVLRS